MMRSKVVRQIKWIRIWFRVLILYWIIYNSIYGWNLAPVDETERLLDNIFKSGLWIGVGAIVGSSLTSIDVVMRYILFKISRREI